MLVQAVVGSAKATSSVPVHRWHGASGKLAFDICLAAVGTGAAGFLPPGPGKLAALLGLLALWLAAQLQHEAAARKADGEIKAPTKASQVRTRERCWRAPHNARCAAAAAAVPTSRALPCVALLPWRGQCGLSFGGGGVA